MTNFFAGLYIKADRSIEVGHFIRLENGEEGYVTDVGWRSTRIRMLPNNLVVIPNSKLVQSIITNYSEKFKICRRLSWRVERQLPRSCWCYSWRRREGVEPRNAVKGSKKMLEN